MFCLTTLYRAGLFSEATESLHNVSKIQARVCLRDKAPAAELEATEKVIQRLPEPEPPFVREKQTPAADLWVIARLWHCQQRRSTFVERKQNAFGVTVGKTHGI